MSNSGTGSARVSYREQQVITRADLTSEQQYLIAARRRHNIGPHLWGIVFGLELQVSGGVVSITAGFAVDGYGRELILAENIDVPPSALLELNADRVALWLIYDRLDRVVPSAGEWNCAPGAENRAIERVRLRLTAVDAGATIDPRQPPEVITTDRNFAPQQDPPDDPAVLWPVFLGLVGRADGSQWSLSAELESQRPYAGLCGQTITAASGIARVRAGHEVEGDNRAFAVETGGAGSLTEQLGIDLAGGIFLAQKTTVLPSGTAHPGDGNLQIRRAVPDVTATRRVGLAGCEESGAETQPRFWGMLFDRIPPPKVATPWRVYRAGVPALPPPEPPAVPFDELRVEFLDPGRKANRKGSRFVIGTRNEGGEFVRCITIDAERTVTVNGTLKVKGQVIMGPLQADPSDARMQSLILGGWLQGMLGNTGQLATYYDARITMALTAPPQAFVGKPFALDVTVTNIGSIRLAAVHVTETHNLSTAQATLPETFTLAPHEQREVEVSYEIGAPGHFTCEIGVTALAQGASYEVKASGGATLEIMHKAKIRSEVEVQAHTVVGTTVPYSVAVENAGQDVLSRVFLTTAVDNGTHVTAEDLLTDSFLQQTERRRFDRMARRDTPGSLIIKAQSGGSGAGPNNGDSATAEKIVHFHEAATFTVSIPDLGSGTSHNPMPFTVRVRNTSPEMVTLESVKLTKSGTRPPGTFAPIVPSSGQTIAPNQNLDVAATFTPGQVTSTTNLEITADVGVTGAGGDIVGQSATATARVSRTADS